MSNKKISALDPIVTSGDTDVLAIVDVSGASPVTKKQTKANFLSEVNAAIEEHVEDTGNPHGTTAEQLGVYTQEQVNTILAALAISTPEDVTVENADEARVQFTFANPPQLVFINGMYQSPVVDYAVNGNQVTFVLAPYTGSRIVSRRILIQ